MELPQPARRAGVIIPTLKQSNLQSREGSLTTPDANPAPPKAKRTLEGQSGIWTELDFLL